MAINFIRHHFPRPLRASAAMRIALVVALALTVTALTGCRRVPNPQVQFAEPGILATFKRYERNAERDFLHRWQRTAYRLADVGDWGPESDQGIVLGEWGAPDYTRDFDSMQNEDVVEWVFIDEQAIFQFVYGDLVYDGALTDYEMLLLQHGYPDTMVTEINDQGNVRHAFYYDSIFWPSRMDVYNLTNGWITLKQEGS